MEATAQVREELSKLSSDDYEHFVGLETEEWAVIASAFHAKMAKWMPGMCAGQSFNLVNQMAKLDDDGEHFTIMVAAGFVRPILAYLESSEPPKLLESA